MKKILDSLDPSLRVVTNFGLVDICPLRSGKHNAAAYLAREHFDIPLANCASMGDDDNDIALVRDGVRAVFLFSGCFCFFVVVCVLSDAFSSGFPRRRLFHRLNDPERLSR